MRTNTPPAIKWLLVERATLLGDIGRLQRKQEALSAKILTLQSKIQALDHSARLIESSVRPDAAGVIYRHCEKYGERGALQEFIVSTLRHADTGLTARALALQASGYFQLEFAAKSDLFSFIRNSLRPRLQELRKEGFLENRPGPGRDGMLWFWKEQLPTLAELAAHARTPPRGGPSEDQDKVRGEVAGE